MPDLSDLELLQRAGLIVKERAKARFQLTEAGKRYGAFIESDQPSSSRSSLSSFDQPNFIERPRPL